MLAPWRWAAERPAGRVTGIPGARLAVAEPLAGTVRGGARGRWLAIVEVWLATPFECGRHERRTELIDQNGEMQ